MPINYPGTFDPSTGLIPDQGLLDSPGPGGVGSGLASGAAIINAIRSSQLAREADAQRKLKYMVEATSAMEQSGGQYFDNPEGQNVLSALDISPETATQQYETSPTGRMSKAFRNFVETNKRSPKLQEMQSMYLEQNVPFPAGFLSEVGREIGTEAKIYGINVRDTRAVSKEINKRIGDLAKQGVPFNDAWNQVAAETGIFGLGLSEQQMKALHAAAVSASEASSGEATPLSEATVGEKEARTSLDTARANYFAAITDPMARKLAAEAGYASAHAEGVKAATELQKIFGPKGAKGGMTAGTELSAMARVANLENKAKLWDFIAANQTDQAKKNAAIGTANAFRDGAQEVRAKIEEFRAKGAMTAPTSPAAPAPAGQKYDPKLVVGTGTDNTTKRKVVRMQNGDILDAETGQKVQ